jgi:hypothetical protein
MTSAREQMLEAAMQELLIRFELVMPRHNWSPELRESMKRGYDSLVGGMPERDQQALCDEAFDCGGMAANPAAYMVEADKKLAVDREWALKEVRAQVLEECKAFTRHAEDCAIWRPDAPACTCGYQAWLNREQPGWYAGKGWYSHSALVGPSHVDTTRLAPQAGEAVYVEQHDAEQMRLDRLLFGNSPTRLERAPDGRLVLRAIPAARMVGGHDGRRRHGRERQRLRELRTRRRGFDERHPGSLRAHGPAAETHRHRPGIHRAGIPADRAASHQP